MTPWLEIRRGNAPLLVSFPHSGTEIVRRLEGRFVSPWLARKDTDWWIDRLYGFAGDLGATTVRTSVSRSVIDVNRDPSGASLYPGMATTELCPTTTFDGEPLYRPDDMPGGEEITSRRSTWFDPYHNTLAEEVARLRRVHPIVVLYDAHSIRSTIPRLFDGELPHFNIGTNSGASCSNALAEAVRNVCCTGSASTALNGRFKGGWTTRRYGRPEAGVHAIQMELSCRAYLREPTVVTPRSWPVPFDATYAAPASKVLGRALRACLAFAQDLNGANR